jgi:hypothetical protein
VSPILVRPVREQLEHDRIIRLLHGKSRRKYDAGMNPGAEQNAPVGSGAAAVFPDVVLHSLERGRRLEAIVEVETGESVNHLEALAQWAHFSRIRAHFHLYVPSGMVDVARRLCEDNHIAVTEVWSYHTVGDDVRFTLIHRSKDAPLPAPAPRRAAAPAPAAQSRRPAASAAAKRPAAAKRAVPKQAAAPKRAASKAKRPAARPAKAAAPRRAGKPVKKKASRPQKRK